VSSEFDRAKRERPGLVANLAPATLDSPEAALLVAVREHEWVGGHCIRGCREMTGE
jgi:hypothetical protein